MKSTPYSFHFAFHNSAVAICRCGSWTDAETDHFTRPWIPVL